jgi:hypothetical protein
MPMFFNNGFARLFFKLLKFVKQLIEQLADAKWRELPQFVFIHIHKRKNSERK